MAKIQRSSMTQTDAKGKVLREPAMGAEAAVNFRWWDVDEDEMAAAIGGTVLYIQRHQGSRMEQLVASTRLYGMSSTFALMGTAFTRQGTINSNPQNQKISFNICELVIDTLESKMAKNKVIPTYITNGGEWDLQKKATELTKFTQGLFYEEKAHKKLIHAWGDAAVWGDGFIHVFEKHDKVCFERVLPHELFVDTIESLTCPPQQLHRVKIIDRDIAYEMFPELEEEISIVSPANYQEIGGQGTAVDLISVIESWHLPSGPKADDGRHVITIGKRCIAEDYEEDYFPFAHARYARRKLGWYGQGVCERLQAFQGEINRCMILKQRALWMQSAFKILVEQGSKVVSQHLSNDIGTIIHYSSTPPQYITPPATNPELQQWIDALVTYALQQEGVSRLSTTGEAPIGVDSGKALRTLTQISDDRFLFMSQELEDTGLEVARQAVKIVKKIYKKKGTYEVLFPNTNFLETVDWKDINLEESQYTLKAFPTSSLSDDLTGRLSEIQELTQAGFVDKQTSMVLLDIPDLQKVYDIQNAPYNLLQKIFEDMLHDKKVTRFEPGFHNAQLAQKMGLEYINYAELKGCPEENIQLVRDYLAQVNTEALSPMPGVTAPPQGAMGAQPTAAPMPTPQNNLIPNSAGVST